MTTKLYDLYASPKMDRNTTMFVMRASMLVVRDYIEMHRDATSRVKAELEADEPVSFLYHSRGKFTSIVHAIQRASAPLGTEV